VTGQFALVASDLLQDLISYRIEQLNPLKLAMCAEATGTTQYSLESSITSDRRRISRRLLRGNISGRCI
jgi:hypothetical protein